MEIVTTAHFKIATYQNGDKLAEKFALVIPGRLDTKDYYHMKSYVDFLAGKGFFAVSFDPAGTWDSPGGTELCTTTNYLTTICELIECFGNRKTLLVGHSRGGAAAILEGSVNPLVWSIVLVMSSYSAPSAPDPDDLQKGFKLEYRDYPPGVIKSDKQREFHLPMTYFKDGEKYNPAGVLENCHKPKLLIYGTHDEFTEPSEVKDIFNNIPEPKMIHEVDSPHDYRYLPAVVDEVNKATGRFVEKFDF